MSRCPNCGHEVSAPPSCYAAKWASMWEVRGPLVVECGPLDGRHVHYVSPTETVCTDWEPCEGTVPLLPIAAASSENGEEQ